MEISLKHKKKHKHRDSSDDRNKKHKSRKHSHRHRQRSRSNSPARKEDSFRSDSPADTSSHGNIKKYSDKSKQYSESKVSRSDAHNSGDRKNVYKTRRSPGRDYDYDQKYNHSCDSDEETPHRKTKESHQQKKYEKKYKHYSDSEEEISHKDDGKTHNREKYKKHYKHTRDSDEEKTDRKSKKYYSDSDDSLEEKEIDYKFDFAAYRSSFNKIFFRDDDFIQRGTTEYHEFWTFLGKYQAFQLRKLQKRDENSQKDMKAHEASEEGRLGLPRRYDKRYRINTSLTSKTVEDFIRKGRLVDGNTDKEVTVARVKQFKDILLHYIDFLHKQKFAKLKKIKTDQENLPIFNYRQTIVDMVHKHQIVIVAGDTGCGKSTQVPQYLLEAGFTNIACTQPRRIACISLSKRVGYETLNEYGSEVAFQVRFEKTKTRFTRILFLTEGLLLRQMTSDPELKLYDVIVIDEVHERHINTDFLLGILKCLLQTRSDLKLVLMSATINIDLFSGYFQEAPVVKVPGRLYPIQVEYCPIPLDKDGPKTQKLDPSPYLRVMQIIDKKYPDTERGDLLIFLSGLTEIMTVVEAAKLYAQNTKRWIVLPLHSALSVADQDKIFDIAPEGARKCIVSTNIAETSVTIDGVRFIADSGKVKEMSYDPKYKMKKLQEFWISRASAEQRKGRAGRTGPGVCYRLYDTGDYDAFQDYTTPEIQRVPIDDLVLQMISMGLPDARRFPFLESPGDNSVENAVLHLKEQGALNEDETITPIGQMLSLLPVDVAIGKMLIMGSIFDMIDPVLSIAAAMSVQSPFTSKAHTDVDEMAARKPLESDHGDPFTLLNAFDEWIQVKAIGHGTRKWCKRRGLEEQRFYEMTKLKEQFKQLLKDHHLLEGDPEKERFYTSEERRSKHAERKRLGQLKRDKDRESKKRKVLKLEDQDYTISSGEEDDKQEDIKDLEFRLTHDLNSLQEKSNTTRNFRLRDINLLKIILCSGLFPQVAIADDCNSYKSDSEQAFHTNNKPFLLLHPTSVFACHPELLEVEIKDNPSDPSDLRGKLSNKHILITYVFLLETNKPYLMNTMRVPALQSSTLFSHAIDTNSDCTRFVCDGWLEIRLPSSEEGQLVISSIIQLRSAWHNLLLLKLEDTFRTEDEEKKINPHARKIQRLLARKLSEFLECDVKYAIRRILTAEKENLYKGPGAELLEDDHLPKLIGGEARKEHPVKGGIQVNSYLTYSCLMDDVTASAYAEFTSHMTRHWTCPRCDVSMLVNLGQRLEHESQCHGNSTHDTQETYEDEGNKTNNPLCQLYFCPECQSDLQLTATEILKHKRTHLS